jgi:hypothetical protein
MHIRIARNTLPSIGLSSLTIFAGCLVGNLLSKLMVGRHGLPVNPARDALPASTFRVENLRRLWALSFYPPDRHDPDVI